MPGGAWGRPGCGRGVRASLGAGHEEPRGLAASPSGGSWAFGGAACCTGEGTGSLLGDFCRALSTCEGTARGTQVELCLLPCTQPGWLLALLRSWSPGAAGCRWGGGCPQASFPQGQVKASCRLPLEVYGCLCTQSSTTTAPRLSLLCRSSRSLRSQSPCGAGDRQQQGSRQPLRGGHSTGINLSKQSPELCPILSLSCLCDSQPCPRRQAPLSPALRVHAAPAPSRAWASPAPQPHSRLLLPSLQSSQAKEVPPARPPFPPESDKGREMPSRLGTPLPAHPPGGRQDLYSP